MFSCIWLCTLLSVSFMSLDSFLSLRKKLLLSTNATGIMKNSTAASLTSILEISNVARTSWATVAAIRGTIRHNVSLTSCTSSHEPVQKVARVHAFPSRPPAVHYFGEQPLSQFSPQPDFINDFHPGTCDGKSLLHQHAYHQIYDARTQRPVRITRSNVNDMLAYPYENHRHRDMQHLHDAAHRNGNPPPRRSLPSPPYIIPNTTHFNFCPFACTRKDNNKLVLHRSVRPLLYSMKVGYVTNFICFPFFHKNDSDFVV